MLKNIANRIASKFKDNDTNTILISDLTSQNGFKSVFQAQKSKNLVILIDNSVVMGEVDVLIELADVSQEESASDSGNVASVVSRLGDMKSEDLYVVYPDYEDSSNTIQLNKNIDVKNVDGTRLITPSASYDTSSLLIPGGKSILIVLKKTDQNTKFIMKRSSYLNKICAPVADRARTEGKGQGIASCPVSSSSSVTTSSTSNSGNGYSAGIFWGTTITLLIILIILGVVMGIMFLKRDKPSNDTSSINTGASKPTEVVTLTASSASMTSPVETIGSKLGKLRRFM